MAAKTIKELKGFSGNQILLMKKNDMLFVRKIGNVQRNIDRQAILEKNYPFPKIYGLHKNNFEMEYIHGLDMKTYLTNHNSELLLNFLLEIFNRMSSTAVEKNYQEVYKNKLDEIAFNTNFIFTKEELISKLPTNLKQSEYHGDLTLENIIYNDKKGFVLIDCQTSEYDSYIFDIAKLRQDLECKWFLRNDTLFIDVKLKHLQSELFKKFPEANNDYLLILMLLRVYRYTLPDSYERNFLIDRINKLWK